MSLHGHEDCYLVNIDVWVSQKQRRALGIPCSFRFETACSTVLFVFVDTCRAFSKITTLLTILESSLKADWIAGWMLIVTVIWHNITMIVLSIYFHCFPSHTCCAWFNPFPALALHRCTLSIPNRPVFAAVVFCSKGLKIKRMGSIRLSMDILVGIRSDALLIFVGLCCISCLVLFLSLFYRLPLISGRLLMAHRWARRTTLYMSLPSRSAIFCNMAICSTQRLLAPETFVLVELDRTMIELVE